MDKEKLITVAIGLLVGILIAGGYFAAIKFLPKMSQKPNSVAFVSPVPSPTQSKSISLDAPDDQSTTKSSVATVSGTATPNAKLIIYSNADEKIASADAKGKFSTTIKLEEGENTISVSDLVNTVKRTIILEISL